MRSLLFLTLASASLVLGACQPQSADDPAATASESELSRAGSECVIDTLFVKKGFLADLAASSDPAFIKDYGPTFYKHVEIPKTIDAAITTDEFGEALYTLHGWDFHPEDLEAGSTKAPRFVATLAGSTVVDSKLTFAKARFAAAKALFDGLTQATETTLDHVVPKTHVYDRSWTKVTRTSPAGRIVCERTTYPDVTSVDYSCTFFEVERNMVQAFNAKDARCLTH